MLLLIKWSNNLYNFYHKWTLQIQRKQNTQKGGLGGFSNFDINMTILAISTWTSVPRGSLQNCLMTPIFFNFSKNSDIIWYSLAIESELIPEEKNILSRKSPQTSSEHKPFLILSLYMLQIGNETISTNWEEKTVTTWMDFENLLYNKKLFLHVKKENGNLLYLTWMMGIHKLKICLWLFF